MRTRAFFSGKGKEGRVKGLTAATHIPVAVGIGIAINWYFSLTRLKNALKNVNQTFHG